ncbi:MAG: sel1 repeat family protein [Rhizobiaceae bacterium]|nr:sel1 repeat family protein [Rhizobiaceae bacterium]
MRIFKPSYLLSALIVFAPLALASGAAHAFDASKILEGDTTSKKVFGFFRSFRKDGRKEDALGVLKYAAENGNLAAQWKLGRMYQTGDGVSQDPLAAFNFFKKLAEKSHDVRPNSADWQFSASAFVALGRYYQLGIPGSDLTPNWKQARIMYTTAAMVFGHPEAQFELGRMELNRAGNVYNQRRALRMLRAAHRKGHVGAQALLGHVLFQGEYMKRDAVRGLAMLSQARENAEPRHLDWIAALQEEDFSLASEDERRRAIKLLQAQN